MTCCTMATSTAQEERTACEWRLFTCISVCPDVILFIFSFIFKPFRSSRTIFLNITSGETTKKKLKQRKKSNSKQHFRTYVNCFAETHTAHKL
ncbi:hypothetical protein GDO81_022637 [Engystomops pustulosus]|uniref:Uncharacterized protein n=1 Tax=Engystomops pustulosus TaxID=76066 RepID=A0AAV6YWV2_ENGPU|nr:hypothetical protein GDO81_022637 [Engystomops pustulosus]